MKNKRHWLSGLLGVLASLLIMSTLTAGCSLIIDLNDCEQDEDCIAEKRCEDSVCVPR